jgi:hypothetical protein
MIHSKDNVTGPSILLFQMLMNSVALAAAYRAAHLNVKGLEERDLDLKGRAQSLKVRAIQYPI